jgi:probable F420-dependent oxidoreductase
VTSKGTDPRSRRLIVKLNGLIPLLGADITDLPRVVAEVESWGADGVVIGQHLFYDSNVDHPGSVKLDPSRISLDPMLLLAGIATATSSVALMTGALIAPLHNPIGLAKASATLDQLSAGRFELGLVAGWQRSEFDAVGIPFEDRFAQLEEWVAYCRIHWGASPFSFHGRWINVEQVWSRPGPFGGASLPVYIGGRPTGITARRVVRIGDGWIASEGAGIDTVEQGVQALVRACAEAGRDIGDYRIRATAHPDRGAPDIAAELRTRVAALAEAGATDITVALGELARDRAEAQDLLRGTAEGFPR